MKKISIFFVLVCLLLTSWIVCSAENVSVYIDDKLMQLYDANGNVVYPFIQNGTTYVPIRGVSQVLGCAVEWDEYNHNVLIYKEIDDKEKIAFCNDDTGICIYVDNIKQQLTDANYNTVKPITKNWTTYVPLRGISQALGYKVGWNAESNSVTIKTTYNDKCGSYEWASAYKEYIKNYQLENYSYNSSQAEFYLLYLDSDNVPELYIDSSSVAGGSELCLYDVETKNVVKHHIPFGVLKYIPYANCLVHSGGQMDTYYDYVYAIENNSFVKKYSGTYGAENYDAAMSGKHTYYWCDNKVSASEYKECLNEVCDESKCIFAYNTYNDKTDYNSICNILSELEKTKIENVSFSLSDNQKKVLQECAKRLSECRGGVGSTEFAKDFVFYYYTGKEFERMNEKYLVNWSHEQVNNDYKMLFGYEMPVFSKIWENQSVIFDNGYYGVMPSDFGEDTISYDNITSDGEGGYYVTYTISAFDFGYLGDIVIQIIPSNNSQGFIIKSIK